MGTIIKKAWDPEIENEYEIELPNEDRIREALHNLTFPAEGLKRDDIADNLAEQFSLTDEQRNAIYRNNTRIFNNMVGRVTSTLLKSGKLEKPKRRTFNTPENNKDTENNQDKPDDSRVPSESIGEIYQDIQRKLEKDLLDKIKDNTPEFFEHLVIDLLVNMGYGGSREDAGKAVGRSGDGGIDGIIKEDRLGLDVVYIQAKRQEQTVGEPPIRDFVGALDGEGAQKGIFITTSSFSDKASRFSEKSSKTIVLIDGQQLAEYMIEYNLGVSIVDTYEIKRVDSDYFTEEK